VQSDFLKLKTSQLLYEGVLYNCSARIERNESGVQEVKGNCTEQGLIRFLQECQVEAHTIIRKKDENILQFIPFNSARKRACTVVRHPDDSNLVRVFVKGAPEIVIENCESYFDENGEQRDLTDEAKNHILHDIV
jgi:magnesium-transporting ATPase (P-type)